MRVDNEANLAALGEMFANPHAGRSFIYVSGEIGIGAGIVLDGEVLRRRARLQRRDRARRGAARTARRAAAARTAASSSTPARRRSCAPPASARQRSGPASTSPRGAIAGNRKVLSALDAAGTALGIALAGTINLVDVDTVILGGIYTRLEPWLRAHIARELADRVLAAEWAPVEIRPERARRGRGRDRRRGLGRPGGLGSTGRLDSAALET